MPSPQGAVAGRKESGVAAMLYGRYHGKILGLAMRSGAGGAWKAELREILAEFTSGRAGWKRLRPVITMRSDRSGGGFPNAWL
jgi:hypothetical protein